jgi:hypothetical protein
MGGQSVGDPSSIASYGSVQPFSGRFPHRLVTGRSRVPSRKDSRCQVGVEFEWAAARDRTFGAQPEDKYRHIGGAPSSSGAMTARRLS